MLSGVFTFFGDIAVLICSGRPECKIRERVSIFSTGETGLMSFLLPDHCANLITYSPLAFVFIHSLTVR